MRTQLGSGGSSASRKYLFKDGQLDPSITLGNGLSIKNNMIYTNSAGGTNWTFNYPLKEGQFYCAKLTCTADAGSPGNEAYLSVNIAGKTGVTRFPGEYEQDVILQFGLRVNSATSTIVQYIYTYGNAMAFMEIWIEG